MRSAMLITFALVAAVVEAKKKAAAASVASSDIPLPFFLQIFWPPNATNAKYLVALVAFIWCFLLSSLRSKETEADKQFAERRVTQVLDVLLICLLLSCFFFLVLFFVLFLT